MHTPRPTRADERTGLADRIYDDLVRQILGDEVRPGERFVAERPMAQAYDTTRNTLREAIRRLEHQGLVGVRQGQGVTVRDFRAAGDLTLLEPFLRFGARTEERVGVLRDLMRLRTALMEVLVAFASDRATPPAVAALQAATASQIGAFARGDRQALATGDVAWLDALVTASESLLLRWVSNTFLTVYTAFADRFPALWQVPDSYPTALQALTDAIAARDPAAARRAARAYHDTNDAHVLSVLDRALEEASR